MGLIAAATLLLALGWASRGAQARDDFWRDYRLTRKAPELNVGPPDDPSRLLAQGSRGAMFIAGRLIFWIGLVLLIIGLLNL